MKLFVFCSICMEVFLRLTDFILAAFKAFLITQTMTQL